MKFLLKPILVLACSLAVINQAAWSQPAGIADTTRLEKHISILQQKVFFDFPASAKLSPRVADIMAADPNESRETRVIIDRGNIRMVFLAQELFALGGKTLVEDITAEKEPDFDFSRKVLFDKDSMLAILSTPTRFDSSATAILVNSLLVQSPDNTVSRIDVYINPDAWSLKDEYTRLSENIFKTMAIGTRRINRVAKEEQYSIVGTTRKFLFRLPANYFVTVDEKYDYGVFKINKLKNRLTDTTYTSISIYTGHHPTFFHKEYGYTAGEALISKGQFLETGVDWLYFKDEAQHFYLKEQFVPADAVEKGLVLHVALLSNKKEILDELLRIVEAIKIIQ